MCFAEGSFASKSKRVAAAIAVFVVMALPEVVLIYRSTGKIRLEGKSSLIYAEEIRTAIGQKNNEAIPDEWALHSINANLERTGERTVPKPTLCGRPGSHSDSSLALK